jgi:hypothetical protein
VEDDVTLTGAVDVLTPGDRARHPDSLAVLAYFDGWNQAAGHSPIVFPRLLDRREEKEWRLGWADGRKHRPPDTQPPDDPTDELPEREPEPVLDVAQVHPADTVGTMPDWFHDAEPEGLAPYPPVDGSQPCNQDPEAWFPEKGGSVREAKAMCARCPFTDACREYALDRPDLLGVWGGLSQRERQQLRASEVA